MSFENQFYSLNGSSVMTPLSIIPSNGSNLGSSSAWSPFSAPSFSPYDVTESIFQYSNLLSPYSSSFVPTISASRPISKIQNNSNEKEALRDLTSKFNQSAYSMPSSSLTQYLKSINSNTVSSDYSTNNNYSYTQDNFKHQQHQQQLKLNQELDNILVNTKPVNQTIQPPFLNNRSKLLPKRSDQIDMSDYIRQAAIQRALGGRAKMCTFCKTNGEKEEIYTSHSLKDSADKITCPILMRYACPVCGATGEQTHTKKYCPVLQKKIRMDMLKKMSSNNSTASISSSSSSSSSSTSSSPPSSSFYF